MSSYKQILKQIANMEQRLCIDDPCEILDDILEIAKAPFLLEKEWRKGCMARYAEKNKERLKEYHRNYYLKITKTKRKLKAEQKDVK